VTGMLGRGRWEEEWQGGTPHLLLGGNVCAPTPPFTAHTLQEGICPSLLFWEGRRKEVTRKALAKHTARKGEQYRLRRAARRSAA